MVKMSMSLEEIRNVILLFSSPSWTGPSVISSTIIRNITAVTSHMAYTTRFTPNLTTTILSSHYSYSSPSEEGIIQGLLYVPDLPPNKDHDICIALTAPHIPPTAVRQYNLPPTNYHLIAIAPWVSDRCAGAYLKAVRGESAVKGFIFYMPGDNDDEMLGKKDLLITDDDSDDGGGDDDGDDDNNWMVRIKHPVFAVSGSIGELMMQHMSLYSGNMTEVPFGQDIRKKFNTHEHDYLRVWTELVVKTPPAPLGSWVWAFVVVGLVVGVFAVTSGVMEVVQWQRRAKLRKKVRDGEVDLEGMGIVRRGRLPREVVEGFPLWTYCDPTTTCANETPDRTTSTAPTTDETTTSMATRTSESSTACERSSDLSHQPACPTCLVPFQPLVTTIRELPCGHIFHPSCIDTLLLHTTSLCPVCKTSMLPPGYCPKITNGMVRRERALRKLRGELPGEMSWWDYLRRRSGVKSQARKEGRRSSQMELRVMVKQNRGESEDLSGAWQSKEHETVIPPAALARARCRDDDHAKK